MSIDLIRRARAPFAAPAMRNAILAVGIAALALPSGFALADAPQSFSAPPSFADLAAKVTPAVVNIAAVENVADDSGGGGSDQMPFHFPPGSPFEEFFKHFREGQPQDNGQQQDSGKHKATALGSG